MNLKEFAGRVRHAVKTAENPAAPADPDRPLESEVPVVAVDLLRPQTPSSAASSLRPETKAVPGRETPREAPARPEPRRADIGRAAEVRIGTDPVEGAGRAGRWKSPATVPDLTAVYKEAGIESPLHGYGVDKLTDMLSSPHLASASREVRATAAQVALDAARVPLRDIIDDALLRSKALAAFEADKAFDLQASQMRAERRAQVLRDQVDAFRRQKQAEIEDMKRTIDAADQALAQLRARKRREEERLHRIVTHFVEPRPAVAAAEVKPAPVAAKPIAPAPPAAFTPPAPPAASAAPPATSSPAPSAPTPSTPPSGAPAAGPSSTQSGEPAGQAAAGTPAVKGQA